MDDHNRILKIVRDYPHAQMMVYKSKDSYSYKPCGPEMRWALESLEQQRQINAVLVEGLERIHAELLDCKNMNAWDVCKEALNKAKELEK